MKQVIVIAFGVLLALLVGCNVAKDTATTTEKGGKDAAGLAGKMKGGTVGDVNEDTGDSASGEESGE
jgi:hypothetical protein